jgi:D-alanyl-lipoteichoic acid acyltransferase DltB (MBOAT superfamily)
MIVMLLGGLWHGAAYTFIVWGAIHGAALAVERLLHLHRDDGWGQQLAVRVGWYAVVQSVVLVAWVYFRSQSMEEAGLILGNIAALQDWSIGPRETVGALFLLPIALHHAYVWVEERRLLGPVAPPTRAVLAAGMVYAIVTLYAGTADFIYFQF